MAFALSAKAAMGDGIALVSAREVAALPRSAPEVGGDGAAPSLDERVHETRKTIKRLRALLRLYRGALPRAVYDEEDARLRRLARALGGARDAAALRESLELLVSRAPPDSRARLRDGAAVLAEALGADLPLASNETRATLDSVQEALGAFAERARAVRIERSGFATIAPGFRRTYARGRRAFGQALERTTERRLHRLRALVKRHQYQLTLLEPLWPEPIRASRREAQRLGELLGNDHDLALLEHRMKSVAERREVLSLAPEFRAAVAATHAELRRDALDLAARVYAETPRQITARFRAYFDAWR
ncbi:MAG TPA: CHAD domain-containing protein [Polyangiaceae bacterium]